MPSRTGNSDPSVLSWADHALILLAGAVSAYPGFLLGFHLAAPDMRIALNPEGFLCCGLGLLTGYPLGIQVRLAASTTMKRGYARLAGFVAAAITTAAFAWIVGVVLGQSTHV
jgi:hypothetical protein